VILIHKLLSSLGSQLALVHSFDNGRVLSDPADSAVENCVFNNFAAQLEVLLAEVLGDFQNHVFIVHDERIHLLVIHLRLHLCSLTAVSSPCVICF